MTLKTGVNAKIAEEEK